MIRRELNLRFEKGLAVGISNDDGKGLRRGRQADVA